MGTRHLYICRHGSADVFGRLTETGRRQADALADRLRPMPIDHIWHSPLARAEATARVLARALPSAVTAAADELTDHVPYVPEPGERPPAWAGFFDGYDSATADDGHRRARALSARFARPPDSAEETRHEVLVTHDYPIAWLVRDALGAPKLAWLSITSANAALTVITHGSGRPPAVMMVNDMTHLPAELRWSGFPDGLRP